MQVAPQLPDLIDADLVAERLEDVQVRVGAALDPIAGVTQERGGERPRREPLPDPGGAVEDVGVRRSFGQRGAEQALGLDLLDEGLEAQRRSSTRSRTAAANSSGGSAPSSSTTRSGKREASCSYARPTSAWKPSPSRSIRSGAPS